MQLTEAQVRDLARGRAAPRITGVLRHELTFPSRATAPTPRAVRLMP
jgi:hypothetical protein